MENSRIYKVIYIFKFYHFPKSIFYRKLPCISLRLSACIHSYCDILVECTKNISVRMYAYTYWAIYLRQIYSDLFLQFFFVVFIKIMLTEMVCSHFREKDPLFRMAVPLRPQEYNSVSSKQLQVPDSLKEKFHRKLLKKNASIQEHVPAKISTKRNCFGPSSSCQEVAIMHKTTSSTHKKTLKPTILDSENDLLSESSCKYYQDFGNNCESIYSCRTLSPLNSHANDSDHSDNLLEWKTEQAFCSSLFCWPVLMVLIDHDYLPHEQFWTLLQAAGVNQYQKALGMLNVSQKERILTNSKCGLNTSESISCDCIISSLNNSDSNESTPPIDSRHNDHCCDKVTQPELTTIQDTASCSFDNKFGLVTYPTTSTIDSKQKSSDNEQEDTEDGAINKRQNKRIPGWFGKGLIVNKKRKRF